MFRLVVISVIVAASFTDAAAVLDSRIIGGNEADIANFPYQLSLRNLGSHLCGASIISANWALTAAQCVDGVKDPSVISLVSGSNTLDNGGNVHIASAIYEHPDYDIVDKDYDIALIKIVDSFAEKSVQLADRVLAQVGDKCTASGWGYTSINGNIVNVLHAVQVPIVSQEECRSDYPSRPITERDICAGVKEGGKDSCNGDTGGPLVYNGVQVGLTSWGHGCAMPNKPGVYTNIATFRDWIRSTSGV